MAAQDSDTYLAVLKASYDYQPQSDDEIQIKEDQLLLLLDKVDDEWWKVKIKAATQEAESPAGLVPAAYVEQAEHTSVVRALYDYEATAPGELSLKEDDVLYVYDTEDDWLLVQHSTEEGKAGYIPGNYVEVVDENEPPALAPSRIIVPDSPPRPVSTYVDPADRVASSKAANGAKDDIQTWSVSEIDKKGKKKKGTLGVGNGTVFFASLSDKTPVQKWQSKDVTSVSSEKSKHVSIEIDGSSGPTTLHLHTDSKDHVEQIIAKVQSSRALSANDGEASSPPQSAVDAKKPSVHFSQTSPVIIPPSPAHADKEDSEEEQEEEEEEEPYHAPQAHPAAGLTGEMAVALYDFDADGDDELSVVEGEKLTILEKDGDEWWKCKNAKGAVGVVPASYLEAVANNVISPAPPPRKVPTVDPKEEERKAEEERRRKAEEERKQQEELERYNAAQARKAEAAQKARDSAIAAEAARQKRKEEAASRLSPPPVDKGSSSRSSSDIKTAPSVNSRTSAEVTRPPPEKTRVWHDRSGQFRVEAAFLGFNKGKLRLHKVNGVIVEVPTEKMSIEDMQFVEKLMEKKSRPSRIAEDEDDIPLALSPHAKSRQQNGSAAQPKKGPKIDWFDFFLQAGCDLDDCTRYAASFERDKIDESLLADITESTMRSLGLREGDIIRVKKHIEKRKLTDNISKPSAAVQEQMRKDEELARQLQAQEGTPRGAPPNLFAGPGGVLKQPRRGRPTPSKSVPAVVDLKSIPSVPDSIPRTASPQQIASPARNQTPTLPARPESAARVSGFDDDAWTNRPSSTKPIKSPSPAGRAPSVPPLTPQPPSVPTTPAVPAAAPAVAAASPAPVASPASTGTPTLAKTDADIFEQLAKLSQLRQNSTPSQQQLQPPQQAPQMRLQPSPAPLTMAPTGLTNGMGAGLSPSPMGQLLGQQSTLSPQLQQPYNGPRGPFAPVPANQSLLQPLIPIPTQQTGFPGFVPTKPPVQPSPSPFANQSPFASQLSPPAFLSTQPTGFQPQMQPMMSQPTGFASQQPMMSQPTGFNPLPSMMSQPTGFNPLPSMMSQPTGFGGGLSPMQAQQSPFGNTNGSTMGPMQSQPTGFNPSLNPSMFGPGPTSPPPLPTNNTNNNSPANIFAQMKSGTFAKEDNAPNSGGMNGQTSQWGQSYQGYTGY